MEKSQKQKNNQIVDNGRPRPVSNGMKKDLSNIIIRPHITEKATLSSEKNVYVFEISTRATKTLVSEAVKSKYKVTPVKVSTVTIPSKSVFVRGKKGTKSGYRKAYVYLKEGDKIETL